MYQHGPFPKDIALQCLLPRTYPYHLTLCYDSKDYGEGCAIGDMADDKQSHRYSDDEILEAVRSEQYPTTSNVADALGCSRQAADYRLRNLRESDDVDAKMVGNSLMWSVVDHGTD